MTKREKLINDAATREVDVDGFRRRMERWMDVERAPLPSIHGIVQFIPKIKVPRSKLYEWKRF